MGNIIFVKIVSPAKKNIPRGNSWYCLFIFLMNNIILDQ